MVLSTEDNSDKTEIRLYLKQKKLERLRERRLEENRLIRLEEEKIRSMVALKKSTERIRARSCGKESKNKTVSDSTFSSPKNMISSVTSKSSHQQSSGYIKENGIDDVESPKLINTSDAKANPDDFNHHHLLYEWEYSPDLNRLTEKERWEVYPMIQFLSRQQLEIKNIQWKTREKEDLEQKYRMKAPRRHSIVEMVHGVLNSFRLQRIFVEESVECQKVPKNKPTSISEIIGSQILMNVAPEA
jgi:hypothetical protein